MAHLLRVGGGGGRADGSVSLGRPDSGDTDGTPNEHGALLKQRGGRSGAALQAHEPNSVSVLAQANLCFCRFCVMWVAAAAAPLPPPSGAANANVGISLVRDRRSSAY